MNECKEMKKQNNIACEENKGKTVKMKSSPRDRKKKRNYMRKVKAKK